MLSLTDLDNYYIRLYKELRNYIWDFRTIECIAELEVSIYQRFPQLSEIRYNFNNLYAHVNRICCEDDYLNQAIEDFRNLINSSDELYSRIIQPQEV